MNHFDGLNHVVLATAFEHLGDGNGDEWDDNPEYTRGVVEMVGDLLGMSLDDRDAILTSIRRAGRSS